MFSEFMSYIHILGTVQIILDILSYGEWEWNAYKTSSKTVLENEWEKGDGKPSLTLSLKTIPTFFEDL